jgi:hypothetical protein
MPPDPSPTLLPQGALAFALLFALAGCASPPPAAPSPPTPVIVQAPPPAPAPSPPPRESSTTSPVVLALVHADRMRGLASGDLSQEVARLSAEQPTPLLQVELAMALMQTRAALDAIRAGQLLQRVLGQDSAEARSLHPLCRLLAAQLAELKRLEDQSERQAQQLRDAQRRSEQLSERLDAIRAIERVRPRVQ